MTEPVKPKSFKPYIESKKKVKEFSFRAIFFGVIFGVIFCVGNAYLGLKTGTTISASIPAAILSIALFRFFKDSTILENNLVLDHCNCRRGNGSWCYFYNSSSIFFR